MFFESQKKKFMFFILPKVTVIILVGPILKFLSRFEFRFKFSNFHRHFYQTDFE